jgi:hypothetical protein
VAIAASLFDKIWLAVLGILAAAFSTLSTLSEYRGAQRCMRKLEASGQLLPPMKIEACVIRHSPSAVRSGIQWTEILLLVAIVAFLFDVTWLAKLGAVTAGIRAVDAVLEYWSLCWCERRNGRSGKPSKSARFYFANLWLVRLGRIISRFVRRNVRRLKKYGKKLPPA